VATTPMARAVGAMSRVKVRKVNMSRLSVRVDGMPRLYWLPIRR
jgi:hypothetical protein